MLSLASQLPRIFFRVDHSKIQKITHPVTSNLVKAFVNMIINSRLLLVSDAVFGVSPLFDSNSSAGDFLWNKSGTNARAIFSAGEIEKMRC